MVLSAPREDSLVIIALQKVKTLWGTNPPDMLESMKLWQIDKILHITSTKYISNGVMKHKYEHTYLYFLLIYIVKLTHNNECIFLSLIVEI